LALVAGPAPDKEALTMDTLKIASVELDERDPFGATFNLHLSRDMTDFERQTLPPLLSGRFSPAEARGPSWVAIRNSTIAMIEDHRDLLKRIVAEAESFASRMQDEQSGVAANAAARVEDVRRRAAAIDWT
jgi:hypothetical protein